MSWLRGAARVLCLLIVVVIVLHDCEARRGGGGFRGGSYRGGSRGSSYRSSRSVSRSFRSSSLRRGTSPYTRSNWKYYAGIGMIYGSTRYMRTRRYHDHPNEMPTVCNNQADMSPNGSVWGYFICPRDGEAEDMDYCCGEDRKEYCCRFGDDPGRVAGIVIGVLIGVVIVCVVAYCIARHVCMKKKPKNSGFSQSSVQYQVSTSPPPVSPSSIAYVQASKEGPYSAYPRGDSLGADSQQAPAAPAAPAYGPPGIGFLPPAEKEPLPEGNVYSSIYSDPAYPPPEGGAGAPPLPGFMYPPPPNGPPDGPPNGPTGMYPSQPPPPYSYSSPQ